MVAQKRKGGTDEIVLRAGAQIGFAEAEDDKEFLKDCYIDFGQASRALNIEDPGSIILGRTGSGKTAALIHVRDSQKHVINLEPQDLALNFISNSNVLSFFHEIGVNLDLFFQLLWRHVLCVELLNYHYHVRSKSDAERMIENLKSLFGGNEAKRFAISYLEECGSSFWLESQSRIKEMVEIFEDELKAGVDLSSLQIPINAAASSKITQEQKLEFSDAAKKVVSDVQMRRLGDLVKIMAEKIFGDQQKCYYVLIDRLDEQWVENDLRYRLIQALIETVRSFRKIRTVKIIICLREDLLERVFKYTRSSGFQEEKYEDNIIPIRWNEADLFKAVDSRINSLFKRKYTRNNVGFDDIFPKAIGHEKRVFNYLLQRTQYRPRDIIAFINLIFRHSAGKPNISKLSIDNAEQEYSAKRFEALCTEWDDEHPHLDLMIEFLRGMPSRFNVSELTENAVTKSLFALSERPDSPDNVAQFTKDYFTGTKEFFDLITIVLAILYKVGAIGIKIVATDPVHFSYRSYLKLQFGQISDGSRVSIAPMFWRFLGTYRSKKGTHTDA